MSQCDRILEVLRDGRRHRMEEIHQRVGFCRLNSRISELRDRGHSIVCDKTGGEYVYRLLSLEEGALAEPIGAGRLAPSSSENGVGSLRRTSDAATSGDLVRRSRFEPLRGGEERPSGEKTGGEPSADLAIGDAAKHSPPLSGQQLTVWEGMAA